MKKIYLQITPFFPTEESFRGPYIYDQVQAIKNNSDYEVIVIKTVSMFDKGIKESYIYQGIKVYNFVVYDFPSSIMPGLFNEINSYRLKKFIKNVIKIELLDIKIIHSHVIYPSGMLAVSLGKKFGIKNFIQHHGFDILQTENGRILKGKLKEFNNYFMYKRFLKVLNQTDLNIGVSQKVIDVLKNIEGYTNENSYVLHNGVDTNKFYKIKNLKNDERFLIGCIANFWELKDHITLLKALKKLVENDEKDILIKFIGSGPTFDNCQTFIKNNNLEKYVSFHSELDHKELNKFYNSLDLFVLPSYHEAFGCVYSESLQVEVPIIAIKNQGIEEVIKKEDKEKMIIEKGDSESLSLKILEFKNKKLEIKKYDLDINILINKFLEDNI